MIQATIVTCKDCKTEYAAPRSGKLSKTCPGCKAIARVAQ